MKILLMHGPNLNLLGKRKAIYGSKTLQDIEQNLKETAQAFGIEITAVQSNHEGILIDAIQAAANSYDGVIINPGAYAHYSYAIRDAIEDSPLPFVEVHLTDVMNREEFRQTLVTGEVCLKVIKGSGYSGYEEGLIFLKMIAENQ